jgi:hypothetical protein
VRGYSNRARRPAFSQFAPRVPAQARRRPGPIPRNLSAARSGRRSSQEQWPVVMGPGLRRDDGRDMQWHPRGALRRSFASLVSLRKQRRDREGRVAAAPGALAQKIVARARKPQVQAVTTGLPCAVVYGLYVLSSVNHPVCHRRPREACQLRLDLSARPWGARTTRLRRPRACRSSIGTPRVHRIPLDVRDNRDTPLFRWRNDVSKHHIPKKRTKNIFARSTGQPKSA